MSHDHGCRCPTEDPNTADPPPKGGVDGALRFDWITPRGRHIIFMPLPVGARLAGAKDDMLEAIDEYQRAEHDHYGTKRGPNDPPARSS